MEADATGDDFREAANYGTHGGEPGSGEDVQFTEVDGKILANLNVSNADFCDCRAAAHALNEAADILESVARVAECKDRFERHWPDWALLVRDTYEVEAYLPRLQTVYLSRAVWGADMEGAYAHVLAHLELGHHLVDGPFSREHESDARELAGLWLDRDN